MHGFGIIIDVDVDIDAIVIEILDNNKNYLNFGL